MSEAGAPRSCPGEARGRSCAPALGRSPARPRAGAGRRQPRRQVTRQTPGSGSFRLAVARRGAGAAPPAWPVPRKGQCRGQGGGGAPTGAATSPRPGKRSGARAAAPRSGASLARGARKDFNKNRRQDKPQVGVQQPDKQAGWRAKRACGRRHHPKAPSPARRFWPRARPLFNPAQGRARASLRLEAAPDKRYRLPTRNVPSCDQPGRVQPRQGAGPGQPPEAGPRLRARAGAAPPGRTLREIKAGAAYPNCLRV